MSDNKLSSLDQSGLDAHFRTFFRSQATDFRAAAITDIAARRLQPDQNVLDLGCGSCVLTHKLLRLGFEVVSVDPSSEMLSMAREFLISEGLTGASIHQLDIAGCVERFGSAFEQIVCLDVIEHIADDDAAVEGIVQLLKENGRLLLSVPALPALYGPKDIRVGHYRRYSRNQLLGLLRAHGLKINSCRYWNLLGVPITWWCVKVLRREVDESARRTKRTAFHRLLNSLLRGWFLGVESWLRLPLGLTLVVEATKPPVVIGRNTS